MAGALGTELGLTVFVTSDFNTKTSVRTEYNFDLFAVLLPVNQKQRPLKFRRSPNSAIQATRETHNIFQNECYKGNFVLKDTGKRWFELFGTESNDRIIRKQ
jgi:hypothetical protein